MSMARDCAALVAACALLCGCGSAKVEQPAARKLSDGETASGAMNFSGDKLEIDCPGRFDVPPRAADMPIDDIVGLRLGVEYDTALRFAQCPDGREADTVTSEGFGANFSRDDRGLKIRESATVAVGTHPDKPKRNRNVLENEPVDELDDVTAVWNFMADGMPGKEIVYGIWRKQPFADDAQPTIQSQSQALIAKYGKPTLSDRDGRALYWMQTPDGKPVPEFDRATIQQCRYSAQPRNQSVRYTADCGRMLAAEIEPAQNLVQARSVSVAAFDPARLFAYQNGRFEQERDATAGADASARSRNAKGGSF